MLDLSINESKEVISSLRVMVESEKAINNAINVSKTDLNSILSYIHFLEEDLCAKQAKIENLIIEYCPEQMIFMEDLFKGESNE